METSHVNREKLTASLSLDLDNQWSYMKTHGDSGWRSYPSYLNLVVPRVLEFLKGRGLTITFFVVGQDAALDKNREALASIAAAGHEIGNHSFRHEQWLHLYSYAEIEEELTVAEEHIERVTGQRPKGFRGPGFSLSEVTLRCLSKRGYCYDASTFPTFVGPLARAYYFRAAKLTAEERHERERLFGGFKEGFRPLKPYCWKMKTGSLIEIPVTTMPLLRIPIHVSYLLYLSLLSPSLAIYYFRTALRLCRLTKTPLSLLLHPLDFLGLDDLQGLSFFPAMKVPSEQKLEVLNEILVLLASQFNVRTMQQHAAEIAQTPGLQPVQLCGGPLGTMSGLTEELD
jgi:peptidoglycan/xylan/chitin deacetylase (PgdA/CDA1 family)